MPTRLYLKTAQRHRTRENGEDPPRYAPDELAALHAEDLETAAGGGALGSMRASLGWKSPEGQELLDAWEEAAQRRLAIVEDGEPLEIVYDEYDGEA
jgi:hypothetical protein